MHLKYFGIAIPVNRFMRLSLTSKAKGHIALKHSPLAGTGGQDANPDPSNLGVGNSTVIFNHPPKSKFNNPPKNLYAALYMNKLIK